MQPRTGYVVGSTPEKIRGAELRASYGYFDLAGDLCEVMMSDDRVIAALDKLRACTSLPLHFEFLGSIRKIEGRSGYQGARPRLVYRHHR